MKKQILILTLALISYRKIYAFTQVKDLAITCSMQAVVSDVNNINYHKGLPPQGRFGGQEPSVSFNARLKILQQDEGCSVLKDKYKIFINDLVANGSYIAGQESDVEYAVQLKNQQITLSLNQYIGYKLGEQSLPLFPQVHSEKLSLDFKTDKLSGSAPLSFDLNWVYSVTSLKNLTDIQKLSLAEKVSQYVFAKGNTWVARNEFWSLFLQLEPQAQNLKKSYALLIWKMLKDYKQASPYNYEILRFHVGGEGSFTGAPLAVKLNKISHISDTFSSYEIVELLKQFPTWILAGYSEQECLNFSAEDLENFVLAMYLQLPILSASEKFNLKDPMTQIAGPIHFVSNCTKGKVTDKAKTLAQEILKVLN